MISKNDNSPLSWLQMGNLKMNELLAPCIPLADWLIAKHCTKSWKNHPETSEYQAAQHSLCTVLIVPCSSKEWTCRHLAIYLYCDVLPMMNDPETLSRIPEYTPEHLEIAKQIIQID